VGGGCHTKKGWSGCGGLNGGGRIKGVGNDFETWGANYNKERGPKKKILGKFSKGGRKAIGNGEEVPQPKTWHHG